MWFLASYLQILPSHSLSFLVHSYVWLVFLAIVILHTMLAPRDSKCIQWTIWFIASEFVVFSSSGSQVLLRTIISNPVTSIRPSKCIPQPPRTSLYSWLLPDRKPSYSQIHNIRPSKRDSAPTESARMLCRPLRKARQTVCIRISSDRKVRDISL